MSMILTELVRGPAAWKGHELACQASWIYRLSPQALEDIDAALRKVQRERRPMEAIRSVDFPLPSLTDDLLKIADELERGRGFVQIKGLPVERYTEEELKLLYWGIASYLGIAVSQNAQGHLIGGVRDLNLDIR